MNEYYSTKQVMLVLIILAAIVFVFVSIGRVYL